MSRLADQTERWRSVAYKSFQTLSVIIYIFISIIERIKIYSLPHYADEISRRTTLQVFAIHFRSYYQSLQGLVVRHPSRGYSFLRRTRHIKDYVIKLVATKQSVK